MNDVEIISAAVRTYYLDMVDAGKLYARVSGIVKINQIFA